MNKQPIENYGQKCSICRADYDGWGQSAEPVNHGRCCNRCNDRVVIPAKIAQMRKESDAA